MTPSRVWLAWLAANVVPSVIVSLLLTAAGGALGADRSVIVAYVVLFTLVAALQSRVVGQWRERRGDAGPLRPGRWALRTIVGLIVAMFFGVGTVATLDGLGHEWLGLIAGWTIAGVILGITQAAALGVPLASAAWWVAATIAGWAGAAAVYSRIASVGAPIARAPGMRWLVGGLSVEGNVELAITALTFAAYGLLTGAVMARLARHPSVSSARPS